MGFALGAVEVRHNPYYYTENNQIESRNDSLILMDNVDCKGDESSLQNCKFNGWGIHNCKPEEVSSQID